MSRSLIDTKFGRHLISRVFRAQNKLLYIDRELVTRFMLNLSLGVNARWTERFINVDKLDEQTFSLLFEKPDVDKIISLFKWPERLVIEKKSVDQRVANLLNGELRGSLQYLHYYQPINNYTLHQARELAYAHALAWTLTKYRMNRPADREAVLSADIFVNQHIRQKALSLIDSGLYQKISTDGPKIASILTDSNTDYRAQRGKITILTKRLYVFYERCIHPHKEDADSICYTLLLNLILTNPKICPPAVSLVDFNEMPFFESDPDVIELAEFASSDIGRFTCEIEQELGIRLHRPTEAICISVIDLEFRNSKVYSRYEKCLTVWDRATGFLFHAIITTGELKEFREALRVIIEACSFYVPRYLFYSPNVQQFVNENNDVLSLFGIRTESCCKQPEMFYDFLTFYCTPPLLPSFTIKRSKQSPSYLITFQDMDDVDTQHNLFKSLIEEFNNRKLNSSIVSPRACLYARIRFGAKVDMRQFAVAFYQRVPCKVLQTVCLVIKDDYVYVFDLSSPLHDIDSVLIDPFDFSNDAFVVTRHDYVKASYRCKFIDNNIAWIKSIKDMPDIFDARRESSKLLRLDNSVIEPPASSKLFAKHKTRVLRKR